MPAPRHSSVTWANAAGSPRHPRGSTRLRAYLQKLEIARGVLANYEDLLANGGVDIRELVVSKRITREPRDYQKAGVTAIAAQQLFGSGVKLRPGQNIEYIITNSEAHVPNDRVPPDAFREGWFGYDRKKYAAMLHEGLRALRSEIGRA